MSFLSSDFLLNMCARYFLGDIRRFFLKFFDLTCYIKTIKTMIIKHNGFWKDHKVTEEFLFEESLNIGVVYLKLKIFLFKFMIESK